MWTLHTANADHWVPIATVASFKRMRQFQSKGVPWLADVLRQSESLLEIDETSTKVRRREEVQEPKDQFERSVYAVCFFFWYFKVRKIINRDHVERFW